VEVKEESQSQGMTGQFFEILIGSQAVVAES